jgi:hypothetical protein
MSNRITRWFEDRHDRNVQRAAAMPRKSGAVSSKVGNGAPSSPLGATECEVGTPESPDATEARWQYEKGIKGALRYVDETYGSKAQIERLTAQVARMAADLLAKDATIERQVIRVDRARRANRTLGIGYRTELRERDATIERLSRDNFKMWRQLKEAREMAACQERHPAGKDFIGADLGDDDLDAVERLRAARVQAALERRAL